jgi:hypothetical protein
MPRSSVADVADGEVRGNAKLRRLHDDRKIRTEPPYGEPESAEEDAEGSGRPKSRRGGAHRRDS